MEAMPGSVAAVAAGTLVGLLLVGCPSGQLPVEEPRPAEELRPILRTGEGLEPEDNYRIEYEYGEGTHVHWTGATRYDGDGAVEWTVDGELDERGFWTERTWSFPDGSIHWKGVHETTWDADRFQLVAETGWWPDPWSGELVPTVDATYELDPAGRRRSERVLMWAVQGTGDGIDHWLADDVRCRYERWEGSLVGANLQQARCELWLAYDRDGNLEYQHETDYDDDGRRVAYRLDGDGVIDDRRWYVVHLDGEGRLSRIDGFGDQELSGDPLERSTYAYDQGVLVSEVNERVDEQGALAVTSRVARRWLRHPLDGPTGARVETRRSDADGAPLRDFAELEWTAARLVVRTVDVDGTELRLVTDDLERIVLEPRP